MQARRNEYRISFESGIDMIKWKRLKNVSSTFANRKVKWNRFSKRDQPILEMKAKRT